MRHELCTYEYDPVEILKVLRSVERANSFSTVQVLPRFYRDRIAKFLSTKPSHILLATLPSGFVGPIHRDRLQNGSFQTEAFNIPILNCGEVYMRWYADAKPSTMELGPGRFPIPLLDEGEEIDSTSLMMPTKVNPSTWHRVENRSKYEAIVLSLRHG